MSFDLLSDQIILSMLNMYTNYHFKNENNRMLHAQKILTKGIIFNQIFLVYCLFMFNVYTKFCENTHFYNYKMPLGIYR